MNSSEHTIWRRVVWSLAIISTFILLAAQRLRTPRASRSDRRLACRCLAHRATTIALLRALTTLGPRLHDATTARDAQALYALVSQTLRACGLFVAFTEIVPSSIADIDIGARRPLARKSTPRRSAPRWQRNGRRNGKRSSQPPRRRHRASTTRCGRGLSADRQTSHRIARTGVRTLRRCAGAGGDAGSSRTSATL